MALIRFSDLYGNNGNPNTAGDSNANPIPTSVSGTIGSAVDNDETPKFSWLIFVMVLIFIRMLEEFA